MLILKEIKKLHDSAYDHNTITRERAADDLVFYWITQWDDNLLGESQLNWRGEFNIIRKAGRQIMQDLRANPVQVNFESVNEERKDGGDLLDGLYRASTNVNTSMEAFDNAMVENVVCGTGAWELYSEYETRKGAETKQVIRRRPILEANNTLFWQPQAKRKDKSDADWVSLLEAYTDDGYRDLVKDLTGEDPGEGSMSSFKTPEESYVFPWAAGKNENIWITSFFHREKVKAKILVLSSAYGEPLSIYEEDFKASMDDLIDSDYEIIGEKEGERWEVRKYIASGKEILNGKMGDSGEREGEIIAGENIPIVPVYGERAYIEGEEHWEGVTRLAKDPQRFRNFVMSYLGDIVARGPRPKDIFYPEQVQGHLEMYEENGADNNFPFVYQNRFSADGDELPMGPVGRLNEHGVPESLMQSIALTRQAVEDVANPGLPQDMLDSDLSGKAIKTLQARLDDQSMVYQQNRKHSLRRDGEIYASMASEVFDTPREVTTMLPDGNRKKVMVMESIQDPETGEMVVLNDISNAEFDVYADIGPDYSTKTEEIRAQLSEMQVSAAGDPVLQKMLLLKQMTLVDGIAFDDVREYGRKQLILMGVAEPETDEEKQLLEQSKQQQDQPDPAVLLAMAEMKKGDAAMVREQREALKDQAQAANNEGKLQVDVFEAQTDRMDVQVAAEKAGADINYKNIQAFGEQLENQYKIAESFRGRLNP